MCPETTVDDPPELPSTVVPMAPGTPWMMMLQALRCGEDVLF